MDASNLVSETRFDLYRQAAGAQEHRAIDSRPTICPHRRPDRASAIVFGITRVTHSPWHNHTTLGVRAAQKPGRVEG